MIRLALPACNDSQKLWSITLKKHTVKSLFTRLAKGGLKKGFLKGAILPEWWDKSCEDDESLLPDLEIRVARFLKLPVETVRNPTCDLAVPPYVGARLRRLGETHQEKLRPAVHTAIQIARAVVRNLKPQVGAVRLPSANALQLYQQLANGKAVQLEALVEAVWGFGIPIVPFEGLPTPGFQGMACLAEKRPVILLGYKHDEPGRTAHVIAHELGHLALGDCNEENPVIDQDFDEGDSDQVEQKAEAYANQLLVGDQDVPKLRSNNFKVLAKEAWDLEQKKGVSASRILFEWAKTSSDYKTATLALKALNQASGAKRIVLNQFNQMLDLKDLSETDQLLLKCIAKN